MFSLTLLRLKEKTTVTLVPTRYLQSRAREPRPVPTHSPDEGQPGGSTWLRGQEEKRSVGEGKGPWNPAWQ